MTTCPVCNLGTMEPRVIEHPIRHNGRWVLAEHVPADVCDTCGETLLTAEVVERLERTLALPPSSSRRIEVFDLHLPERNSSDVLPSTVAVR